MSLLDGNTTVRAMIDDQPLPAWTSAKAAPCAPSMTRRDSASSSARAPSSAPLRERGISLARATTLAVFLLAGLLGCSSANIVDVDGPVDSGARDSTVNDAADVSDAGPNLPMPNAAGVIVITEIMVDSAVAGNGDQEWFELYNPSVTEAWNLKGCAVADPSGMAVVQVDLPIQPQERLVFGHQNTSTLLNLDFNYGSAIAFNNNLDNDALFVRCGELLIDEVLFTALPSPAPGYALNLAPGKETAALNDSDTSWCRATSLFSNVGGLEDYGTPGTPNSVCPSP